MKGLPQSPRDNIVIYYDNYFRLQWKYAIFKDVVMSLYTGAIYNNVKICEKILSKNLVDRYKNLYSNGMCMAGEHGHLDIMKLLLPKSDVFFDNGKILKYCAIGGNLDCLNFVLSFYEGEVDSKGIDWKHSKDIGNAQIWACKNGNLNVLKILIERFNICVSHYYTLCINNATSHGHYDCLVYLIELFDMVTFKENYVIIYEVSPLQLAAIKGYIDCVKYLTNYFDDYHDAFKEAIKHNHEDCATFLIDYCKDTFIESELNALLDVTSKNGYVNCLALLISHISTDELMVYIQGALKNATSYGQLECLKLLSVYVENNEHELSWMLVNVLKSKNIDCLLYLIDISMGKVKFDEAFCVSIYENFTDAVSILLAHVDYKTVRQIYEYVCGHTNLEIVHMLTKICKIDKEIILKGFNNALLKQKFYTIKFLLTYLPKKRISPALFNAINNGYHEGVMLLTPYVAESDIKRGKNPIAFAVEKKKSWDILKTLVEHFCKTEWCTEALKVAAKKGYIHHLKIVLPYADPTDNNFEAIKLAFMEKNEACVDALIPCTDTRLLLELGIIAY